MLLELLMIMVKQDMVDLIKIYTLKKTIQIIADWYKKDIDYWGFDFDTSRNTELLEMSDLRELFDKHQCDKGTDKHHYYKEYEPYFENKRNEPCKHT